ncbi:cytochrome P450 [Propylenella binzhouense]|uniref:Cytochrome P450 n=1 Tax=Propylenella binzhouense TaxID=2555902 RepID=A0A964T0Z7_9HYPH|nr:cytochrome P450 [Propylenella binzhouense]MYZ46418.1 cytochrome P450 [Propylenella binzhouense]
MSDNATGSLDGYDIFSEGYRNRPADYWGDLAQSRCPISRTEKWGGSWMLVRYQDVYDVIQNPDTYSSRAVEVAGEIPAPGRGLMMPPITSAVPEHADHRALIDPLLSPAAVKVMEPFIRETAAQLAADLAAKGGGDAAAEFARPLALSVLTRIMDLPRDMQGQFVDWATRILRLGPTDQALRRDTLLEVMAFLEEMIAARRGQGGSDAISVMADATIDGEPIDRKHMLGTLLELVIAGADTTWSTIGASLLHLASSPEDRARLVADPTLIKSAVEEFLRAFAPVTVARISTTDVEVHGRCIHANDRVIMPLAAANRDPEVFEDPDVVKIDRRRNRHMAFGTGTHRCAGAHLARAELNIAIEEWLKVIPEFELVGPDVEWAQGQVRGPESIVFKVSA